MGEKKTKRRKNYTSKQRYSRKKYSRKRNSSKRNSNKRYSNKRYSRKRSKTKERSKKKVGGISNPFKIRTLDYKHIDEGTCTDRKKWGCLPTEVRVNKDEHLKEKGDLCCKVKRIPSGNFDGRHFRFRKTNLFNKPLYKNQTKPTEEIKKSEKKKQKQVKKETPKTYRINITIDFLEALKEKFLEIFFRENKTSTVIRLPLTFLINTKFDKIKSAKYNAEFKTGNPVHISFQKRINGEVDDSFMLAGLKFPLKQINSNNYEIEQSSNSPFRSLMEQIKEQEVEFKKEAPSVLKNSELAKSGFDFVQRILMCFQTGNYEKVNNEIIFIPDDGFPKSYGFKVIIQEDKDNDNTLSLTGLA